MKLLKYIFLLFFFTITFSSSATFRNVLFLGNSYVAVNDLPQMVANVTQSAGDSISFSSNSPGGYTLQNHLNDATSIALINQGGWDCVVLQEQSQLPSFPIGQVQISVFPYAHQLDSIVIANSPCSEIAFYMTWGRKNGDVSNCSSWPPVCTYEGMDSLLRLRYLMMADSNHAIVSPVGVVWNYIRSNYPLIELYQADDSHPTLAGTYAAACTFYSVIFRSNPNNITFDAGLDSITANQIRRAVKLIAFDQDTLFFVRKYDTKADFTYTNLGGYSVSFTNGSINSENYYWDFGDGSFSTDFSPVHNFSSGGNYSVKLISEKCSRTDSITQTVNVVLSEIVENNSTPNFTISPQPANQFLRINANSEFNKIEKFEIINSTGQKILEQRIESLSEIKIATDNIKSGIYLLRIVWLNSHTSTKSFIINN